MPEAMSKMKPLALLPSALARLIVGLMLLFSTLAMPAAAEEAIESFHAAVDLAKSGRMTVTETIRVKAEGYKIKRGIFRDFPLTFTGEDGALHRVDFSIDRIERNGQPETYKTESIDGGIRIWIGDADVFIPRGEHTYSITYETGRQVRYRKDFDELFWNVTGNFWEFPIREASATIMLPEGARPEATTFFTGPMGATDKNARVLEEGNEVFFATTIPLNLREGLTIGLKLAKGVIDPPSQSDLFWWQVNDHSNSIIAIIALSLVLLYFAWNWVRVGRDPSRGVVIPRWDAPMGLSPALVHYVANRGFTSNGWTAFSASVINLAVKGLIILDDLKGTVSFKPTSQKPEKALPLGEDVIYRAVKGVAVLPVDKMNGRKFQKMGDEFRLSIDKEHTGKYYRYNLGVIIWGIILSIVAYLAIVLFGTFHTNMLGMLVVPAVIFVFVSIFSAVLGAVIRSAPNTAIKVMAWIFLSFFWLAMALVLLISAITVFDVAQNFDDVVALSCAGGILVSAVFFTTFMGAATPLGRELMDGIEGLRLYLTVAEKDRMNLAGAPEMSPQHYEKLLPYAVALGMEKQWSSHFQEWLEKAGANANYDYKPQWYTGRDFDSRQFGNRMSTVSSTISTSIASSLPPPPSSSSSGFSSSSSSSGGGSSGGGGGGGGGGGW
jgi:uncharacterized membrane protein YgcG